MVQLVSGPRVLLCRLIPFGVHACPVVSLQSWSILDLGMRLGCRLVLLPSYAFVMGYQLYMQIPNLLLTRFGTNITIRPSCQIFKD